MIDALRLECSYHKGFEDGFLRYSGACVPGEFEACIIRARESLFFSRILPTLFIAVCFIKWYKYLFLPEPEGDWRTVLVKYRSRQLGLP